MYFGGDYNPDQWPEDVWREDVALMRAAGVNLATVGVFSWSRLEPSEGVYDFGWLDRVMDLLHDNGVQVNLATPTASPPPWFTLAHPDAMPVRADGVRLVHGSRDTYCVNAPAYRAASRRVVTALAERYGAHPATVMWHVHNEYGTVCHCDHCAAAFRAWLRDRHKSLDALNEAWTAAFWSQRYSSWEQVLPPRATQWRANPAHLLDYRRFCSDALLGHYREQRDIVAAHGPQPVTTNYVMAGWTPLDHWRWSAEVDLVAIDHYTDEPGDGGLAQIAFASDLALSWARGKPWLLMEQGVGVMYTQERMLALEPGEHVRRGLEYAARGAAGVLHFQWRASRGGAEQWYQGMVPHAGADSRVFREVMELGRRLAALPPARPARPEVAILWDDEAGWALQNPGLPATGLDFWASAQRAHRVLWSHGVAAGFAHPAHDLSGYRAVLVPSLYLMSDESAAGLAAYVEGGGTLVVSYFSGVADPDTRVRLGGYPGALRDLLGVRVEEFRPLAGPVTLSDGTTGDLWSEVVHLAGATATVTYADGGPAITRRRAGAGTAWYLSTGLNASGYAKVLARAGVIRRAE
ncbi:beta-galactosidase [Nonomuraea jiangxiensis]|uniref:beta-galactosidase n=1 Tax=Nonomuraea jiangxiensis TaxID=633440 RepID=A0A1G8DJU9_9ACTN|nr:beta-galactosidase [Nonomuraea jiangxiensis]SDH57963.1 beta-galactosidase [Nonomuraea jiangxiensis]